MAHTNQTEAHPSGGRSEASRESREHGSRENRDDPRGRHARRPWHIPWKGWKEILLRTKDEMGAHRVPLVAAGLSYYAMMSIFPGLIALVSLVGLLIDPATVQQELARTGGEMMPSAARQILQQQLVSIVSSSSASLGIGFGISVGAALWSASAGMKQLIEAINLAYDEDETRGFVKLRGTAILFTLGGIGFVLVAIGTIAVLPILFGTLGLGRVGQTLIAWGRWPFLAFAIMVALALLYRYGPDRKQPRVGWVSVGAIVATLVWIAASVGFSYYASEFGNFNETYGTLAGVVILLLWFLLGGFAILLGAELDSEIEHHMVRDTTVGPDRPLGDREAVKADTVAPPRGRKRGRGGGEERTGGEGREEGERGNGHRPGSAPEAQR